MYYWESPPEDNKSESTDFEGGEVAWELQAEQCPECEQPIMFLIKGIADVIKTGKEDSVLVDIALDHEEFMVWPRGGGRQCPPQVPHSLREDFEEAAQVLEISSKASAALSRRCLQHLLREYAKVKKSDLAKEIEEIVASNVLSSHLAAQLDAVRNIGNFAAHPQKEQSTGVILPVEPHEAEWNLDVLEELFDHYFVKPEKDRDRKNKLNAKLAAAGKPLSP